MGRCSEAVLAVAVGCVATQSALLNAYSGLWPACGSLAAVLFDAVATSLTAAAGVLLFSVLRSSTATPPPELQAQLHWNPEIQHRGIGDLLRSVNHVALIVSDVGRSLAFYTEILGFQQIQRPNFNRHCAWLTMGNTELHLIKGVPNAPSGRDLIVSHIALDTDYPEKVLEKLWELDVPFRRNISVPDPKKARDNLVECFENADDKVTQYFIRDPDGYYWELCNCEILTRFCLFKEGKEDRRSQKTPKYLQLMNSVLGQYNESGEAGPQAFRCPQLFKVGIVVAKLVRRARRNLRTNFDERLVRQLEDAQMADDADPDILQNFLNRQATYCDATQGFKKRQLIDALCLAGNSAPLAMLVLARERQKVLTYHPPRYLLSEGGKVKQQVFLVARRFRRQMESLGTDKMLASKPFLDNSNSCGSQASVASARSLLLRRESIASQVSDTGHVHSCREGADSGDEETSLSAMGADEQDALSGEEDTSSIQEEARVGKEDIDGPAWGTGRSSETADQQASTRLRRVSLREECLGTDTVLASETLSKKCRDRFVSDASTASTCTVSSQPSCTSRRESISSQAESYGGGIGCNKEEDDPSMVANNSVTS